MALHEMDPTTRFSSKAEAYRKYRPDYPASLFDLLLADRPAVVADVGAGTGISSRQLAERGVRVLAVEPNGAMRTSGEKDAGIEWIDGSAESTSLAPHSVDLITCFQAFHWFDPEPAIREFLRILRPGGTIAVIWNERDPSDPFTASYGSLVRRISRDHPAESRTNTIDGLHDARLAPVRSFEFRHAQALDLEGLVGRAASTSYLPSEGPAHEELLEELGRLFDRWKEDGIVTLRYITSLHMTSPGGGRSAS